MLKITPVSAGQADYYTNENHYTKKEAQNYSQWFGEGAKDLGLRGSVQKKKFDHLLNGELPSGEKFRQPPTNPKYKIRAGLDLTFSAPKSVSLAALGNGDRNLELAHRKAVNVALKTVEDRYAATRIRQGGIRHTVGTKNLAIAEFHHDRSRANDPQLHTHAVVVNMTKAQNRWYSLKNDEFYKNQQLIDKIYQNELAHQAQNLGYKIKPSDNGKSFELVGYSNEQLKHFSKRRAKIISLVGAKASAQSREVAALDSRKRKNSELSREELQREWKAEMNRIGIKHPIPQVAATQKISTPQIKIKDQTLNNREEIERKSLNNIGANSWQQIQAKSQDYPAAEEIKQDLNRTKQIENNLRSIYAEYEKKQKITIKNNSQTQSTTQQQERDSYQQSKGMKL